MAEIVRLIQYPACVDGAAPAGEAADVFLADPSAEVVVVVDRGAPLGVIGRGDVRVADAARSVNAIMREPLIAQAGVSEAEAVAAVRAAGPSCLGLVLLDGRTYRGFLSAASLLSPPAADAADAAEADRGFVGQVGRALRTPLSGVLALADLLQKQPLTDDGRMFARTIVESCRTMISALDDAEAILGAEDGALPLDVRPTSLRALVDALQTRWRAEGSVFVAYDGPPDLEVEIDPERVRQVFDGLIRAALERARGNPVEASLSAARDGARVRICGRVRDAGGGDAADASLALTLCARIAERLGGSIRTDANVGAGATTLFEFSAAEAAPEDETDAISLRVKRPAHILVVDDNATNRMVAEALCEMFDCTCECAEDGVEAVETVRSGRFDLVLMDIRMPRMDGVEATRAIRALGTPASSVPIVALTANADPEDKKSYLACGMHSVVEKPIKPEQLLAAINSALPDGAASRSEAAAA